MKKLTLVIACLITIHSFAQTDIIEMRSRNASLKKYARERSNAGDHVTSNFGILNEPTVQNAVLDSVKCISETKIVMYTSSCDAYMVPVYRTTESGLMFQDGYEYAKWQPGADTVENHPLFRHRHNLDSVKMVLDRDYYFNLPADSVKFIGFDNVKGISNEDTIHPVKHKHQQKNSIGWELIILILSPILFVIVMSKLLLPKHNANSTR